MIKNASDLLAAFIAKEREKVETVSMPHMPTLGSAYEAIAKEGIDQQFVLPPNLDLRVVSGFIEGLPNQIDGMLVQGEGQRYGLTDQYIYPARQVLCALEVKKTLNRPALVDGIRHLADILRHCGNDFIARYAADEDFDFSQARASYEKLTGRVGPRSAQALDSLPDPERLLFAVLARQTYTPVAVLLGFDGYATEKGLRSAMVDIVESNMGSNAIVSPELLPSLITAGTFSLVKCTGQPYLATGPKEGWVLQASSRHNVARILLEFLWTKISVFCGVRMPFGPDLDFENLKELLVARGASRDGNVGFEIRTYEHKEKTLQRPEVTDWEPTKLSAAAVNVAEFLALHAGTLKLDPSLADFIQKEHGVVLDDAVAELVNTHTYCRSDTVLRTIGSGASIAVLEDGTGYADLHMGRLRIWCEKQGRKFTPLTLIMVD